MSDKYKIFIGTNIDNFNEDDVYNNGVLMFQDSEYVTANGERQQYTDKQYIQHAAYSNTVKLCAFNGNNQYQRYRMQVSKIPVVKRKISTRHTEYQFNQQTQKYELITIKQFQDQPNWNLVNYDDLTKLYYSTPWGDYSFEDYHNGWKRQYTYLDNTPQYSSLRDALDACNDGYWPGLYNPYPEILNNGVAVIRPIDEELVNTQSKMAENGCVISLECANHYQTQTNFYGRSLLAPISYPIFFVYLREGDNKLTIRAKCFYNVKRYQYFDRNDDDTTTHFYGNKIITDRYFTILNKNAAYVKTPIPGIAIATSENEARSLLNSIPLTDTIQIPVIWNSSYSQTPYQTSFNINISAQNEYYIKITTPPTKLVYNEGDTIDFTGLIVTAYNILDDTPYTNNGQWVNGVIPNNLLTFPVTVADYEQQGGGEISNSYVVLPVAENNYNSIVNNGIFVGNGLYSNGNEHIAAMNSNEYRLALYDQGSSYYIIVVSKALNRYVRYTDMRYSSAYNFDISTRYGETDYYYGSGAGVNKNSYNQTIPVYSSRNEALEALTQASGATQSIPVQFRELEDSFNITVYPTS